MSICVREPASRPADEGRRKTESDVREGCRTARLRLTAAALLGLMLGAGCGSPTVSPGDLEPIPFPDVSQLDPSSQQKLRETYEDLQRQLKELASDRQALGQRFGEAAKLFHAYEFIEAAEAGYKNAQILASTDDRWPYLRAHLYRNSNEPERAIELWETSLRLMREANQPAGKIETTHCWLGEVYLDLDRPEEAAAEFQKALQIRADSAMALFGLGRATVHEDAAQAIDFLRQALRQMPQASNVHYQLILAYRKAGNLQAARQHMQAFQAAGRKLEIHDPLLVEVLSLPESPQIHIMRGDELLFGKGSLPLAIQHYQRALKLGATDPHLHISLGSAWWQSGNLRAAKPHFEKAIELGPNQYMAHANLGIISRSEGDLSRSISFLEKALELNPDDKKVMLELAVSLAKAKRYDDADGWLTRVLEKEPASEQALIGRAMLMLDSKCYGEARARLEQALRQLPDSRAIIFLIVDLLATCRDDAVRDGQRALDLALQVDPSQAPIDGASSRAMAYAELGQFEQAIHWQQRAIQEAERVGWRERLPSLKSSLSEYRQQRPARFPPSAAERITPADQ